MPFLERPQGGDVVLHLDAGRQARFRRTSEGLATKMSDLVAVESYLNQKNYLTDAYRKNLNGTLRTIARLNEKCGNQRDEINRLSRKVAQLKAEVVRMERNAERMGSGGLSADEN